MLLFHEQLRILVGNLATEMTKKESISHLLALPADQFKEEWYRTYYSSNAYSGTTGLIQNLMHRSLEMKYSNSRKFSNVLEIGSNKLEHLGYVQHQFDTYFASDIWSTLELEGLNSVNKNSKVKLVIADIHDIPWDDNHFDRIVVTCVFHHLADPETAYMELLRVLKPGGTLDILLSGDPGILFRFARNVGPIRKAKLQGMREAKTLMDARDHINHVGGLIRLAKHVYRNENLKLKFFPLLMPVWDLALWITIRVVKIETTN